jgi:hypothetical protein
MPVSGDTIKNNKYYQYECVLKGQVNRKKIETMDFDSGKNIRRKIVICLVLSGLGVLYYSTRFFMDGIPHYRSEDTIFHISRLMGLANVWSSPVCYNSFSGTGTYVNLYYPWLTMYPMWLLYRVCSSYTLAYKLYFLFLGIITIFVSYRCMKSMTHDEISAVCFAVLYSFSSYRFANVFRRAAVGESIAMTFLPVVLLGMYNIYFGDEKKWRTLGIGIALIAYSHNLSLLLVAAMITTLGIITFRRWDCRKERIIAFMKAVFTSIVLSLGSLVPMLCASFSNSVFHPEGSIETIQNHADRLGDIINNSVSNVPTAHSIGLLILLALAGYFFLVRNQKTAEPGMRYVSGVFITAGIIMTISASSLLPWGLIGKFPLLRIIQFPWRLNAYATLFIAAAFSIEFTYVKYPVKRMITAAACIAAVVLTWSSVFILHNDEEKRVTDQTIAEMEYEHRDYSPKTAIKYRNQNGYTLNHYYLDGNEADPALTVSENGTSLFVNINTVRKNQVIDIPVYWYTSVQARINGESAASRMSDRGTVLLTIPDDGGNIIEIFHTYDKVTYISWLTSTAFLILLIFTKRRERQAYPIHIF